MVLDDLELLLKVILAGAMSAITRWYNSTKRLNMSSKFYTFQIVTSGVLSNDRPLDTVYVPVRS